MSAHALLYNEVEISLIDESAKSRVLHCGPASSQLETFRSLFGNHWSKRNVLPIDCRQKSFKMQGFIGTDGISNRRKQFVFVNNRLLKKSILQKELKKLFRKSVMGRNCNPTYSPFKTESPTKTSHSHPIYFLQFNCPTSMYDLECGPRKNEIDFHNWNEVLDFVRNEILDFLKENNLLLPGVDLEEDKEESANAKVTSFSQPEYLNFSGIEPIPDDDLEYKEDEEEVVSTPDENDTIEQDKIKIQETDGKALMDIKLLKYGSSKIVGKIVKRKITAKIDNPKLPKLDDGHEDDILENKDNANNNTILTVKPDNSQPVQGSETSNYFCEIPSSSGIHRLLPKGKTPFLTRKMTRSSTLRQRKVEVPKNLSPKKKPEPRNFRKVTEEDEMQDVLRNKWMSQDQKDEALSQKDNTEMKSVKEMLSTWKNPNFAFEKQVVKLKQMRTSKVNESFQFKREMFKNMEVLGQVDCKFIACVVKAKKQEHVLVLFDQHAAHERVRLETLLEGMKLRLLSNELIHKTNHSPGRE